MRKTFSLGKGLQSLIPLKNKSSNEFHPETKESVFYVEVNKISPNPDQPRKDFDPEGLKELAQSIKRYGVLQPLLVSKIERETQRGLEVEYQLIAGERRWRAARLVGLPHVPVIIKDIPELTASKESLEMALIENIQRKNLNPIESAEAFTKLRDAFGLTYEEIAKRIGKNKVSVTNTVRLLGLSDKIRQALQEGRLNEGQGRALLGISDLIKRDEVFQAILTSGLSVRDVEAVASAEIQKKKATLVISKPVGFNSRFGELEKTLSENLGAHVGIRTDEVGRGKILIRFANHGELNTIAKKILD